MLLIVLFAALAVWILVVWIRVLVRRHRWQAPPDREWWRAGSKPSVDPAVWTTVMVGLFGPIAVGILFLILSAAAGESQLARTNDLAALRTGSSVEGTFFLGTGRVDDKPVIRYVTREADGAAVLREVEARQARVYEDAGDDQPRLDVYCPVLTNPWLTPAPFAPQLRCGYYFHVPAGSVLESYEVAP